MEMILIGIGQACMVKFMAIGYVRDYSSMARFIVASFCACMAYLPSHEAQHGNYSRGDPKKRWIDALVVHYSDNRNVSI